MSWLFGKLKLYAALLGASIVGVAIAYAKGRAGGLRSAKGEAAIRTSKTLEEFSRIDASTPDFGKAINNLRKRSLDP